MFFFVFIKNNFFILIGLVDKFKTIKCLGSLSYETSRLKPAPSCPNLSSSYNDGFTSVAIGTTEFESNDVVVGGGCNDSCLQFVVVSADTAGI